MYKLNNILVKRIQLKEFTESTLLMLFNFYLYLYRILPFCERFTPVPSEIKFKLLTIYGD